MMYDPEPTTSTLKIKGLSVFGYHGVLPEEKRLGQRFLVDVEATVESTLAVAQDAYQHAVCYAAMCDRIVKIVAGPPKQLLETVADLVAIDLLAAFPLLGRVRVSVAKQAPPVAHSCGAISVETLKYRHLPFALSLGSNVGASATTLDLAITVLGVTPGLTLEKISQKYVTAPWGEVQQEDFLNLCVTGVTRLTPYELLRHCKTIERQLGRVPGPRWGERIIDIDILYHGSSHLSSPILTLPHPLMTERAFVLVPLAEIAPEFGIEGLTVTQWLEKLPRVPGDVQFYSDPSSASVVKGKRNEGSARMFRPVNGAD